MSQVLDNLKLDVQNRPTDWREGQAAFNYLVWVLPGLAAKIRGTELDPFHHDERLPAFWNHVEGYLL